MNTDLQFGPREDFDRGQVSGFAESKVVMKIERAVATENFTDDGARNLRMAIGGKRGIRRVNQSSENGAIIQAKVGATGQGENRELRCGGAHDDGSKSDAWRADVQVKPHARSKRNLVQSNGAGDVKR